MFDAPQARDGDRTDERPVPDGGRNAATGAVHGLTVVDRTGERTVVDFPPLGGARDEHLFAPVELPREALALPVLAALVVAVGAHASTVLSSALAVSVGVPLVAVAAILLWLQVL